MGIPDHREQQPSDGWLQLASLGYSTYSLEERERSDLYVQMSSPQSLKSPLPVSSSQPRSQPLEHREKPSLDLSLSECLTYKNSVAQNIIIGWSLPLSFEITDDSIGQAEQFVLRVASQWSFYLLICVFLSLSVRTEFYIWGQKRPYQNMDIDFIFFQSRHHWFDPFSVIRLRFHVPQGLISTNIWRTEKLRRTVS